MCDGGDEVQEMTQVKLIILEDSTNISGPPRSKVSGSENIFKIFFNLSEATSITSYFQVCQL